MSVRRAIAEADVASMNVSAFCRDHGISRDRFYAIRRRYEAEGEAGLEPRSRAPHRVANRTSDDVEDQIVRLRKDLVELGVDAGPATIGYHLAGVLDPRASVPSEATIWRILSRRGFIVADPAKSPKKTYRSFAAERANECWQIDDTGWELADGTEVKIVDVLDDCTRTCVASQAVASCTGTEALDAMATGAARWGWPERFLSDNARAFRHTLARSLGELGIDAGHSRIYHPQTCGKVERFHQTLKKWLTARPAATTIAELQTHIDAFVDYYNHQRPHRGINRQIPAQLWATTPRSGPAGHPITTPTRISTNTVSSGAVQPFADVVISLGAAHNGHQATTIITGTQAHVFINGHLVRTLTIDPTRKRQPLYPRPGRPPTT